jgi:hypothetical protein
MCGVDKKGATTLSITTFSIMTFSLMALIIKDLYVKLSNHGLPDPKLILLGGSQDSGLDL